MKHSHNLAVLSGFCFCVRLFFLSNLNHNFIVRPGKSPLSMFNVRILLLGQSHGMNSNEWEIWQGSKCGNLYAFLWLSLIIHTSHIGESYPFAPHHYVVFLSPVKVLTSFYHYGAVWAWFYHGFAAEGRITHVTGHSRDREGALVGLIIGDYYATLVCIPSCIEFDSDEFYKSQYWFGQCLSSNNLDVVDVVKLVSFDHWSGSFSKQFVDSAALSRVRNLFQSCRQIYA